jgi:hypothetical protein
VKPGYFDLAASYREFFTTASNLVGIASNFVELLRTYPKD